MALVTFTGSSGDVGQLNAMFSELYELRSLVGISVNDIRPVGNATQRLGAATLRWSEVYASALIDGLNGTLVSSAGTQANFASGSAWLSVGIYANNAKRIGIDSAGNTTPGVDNAQTMGGGALRWSTVYAATGTINTSDAREKTPVAPLTAGEIAAAAALASEVGTFRFLASVQAKGDAARTHVGMTVQRAIQLMETHGLEPRRYGFVCHDTWEAADEHQAGDRYAFRTDELLLFIARGLAAGQAALEARVTALEAT